MSGIENRIVTMKFDNKEFEKNAATTLSTMSKIKESMSFGSIAGGTIRGLGAITNALGKIGLKTPFAPLINGANAGLEKVGGVLDRLGIKNPFARSTAGAGDMASAADQTTQKMGVLEGGVTAVSKRFVALSTIAITALSNITNRVVNAATNWANSFSFGPIKDGLAEYELNLKSIQTVQANTDRPLTEVNASLDELNKYSDQTIYNFAEMARNVGTFTAAGVGLKDSVSSIKGIANLAALSGSSSEQAAGAMYQLSQAIAAGKVGLMDWNSVVNAGMGGKKLQNALAQTAVAMGNLTEAQVKGAEAGKQLTIAGESFRESISAKPGEEGWLSSEVLVNTLAVMDGRFSSAALAAEKTETGLRKYTKAQIEAKIATNRTNLEQKNGVKYTDEQFEALQRMSTAAFKSATEVKTFGQVVEIAQETLASGWSASFRNIFGDLDQAKKFFTGMSNGLNQILEENAYARNVMLNTWSEGGGRTAMIEALGNAWETLVRLARPIRSAFRDIFPAKTGADLISMTKGFRDFTESLMPSWKTMLQIRDVAKGVFSVLDIGVQVVKGIAAGFGVLFKSTGAGNGNFLELAAAVGRSVTAFAEFLDRSGLIVNFFTSVGGALALPVTLLQGFASLIGSIFDGFNEGKAEAATGTIDKTADGLERLQSAGDKISGFFEGLTGMFVELGRALGRGVVNIGEVMGQFLTSDAFAPALDAVNTGLFAALTLAITKFLRGDGVDISGGFFSRIGDIVDEATGSLSALQTSLKADALLKIGVAIGVLAGALWVLSTIDPAALAKALAAMTGGFAVLITALVTLMKYMGPVGVLQIYAVSSALSKMALSILLMAFALKVLAGIKFGDMLRGLTILGASMYILYKAMIPMAAGSSGMAKAAASLILVGIALNILAVALKIFATMSWEEMAKGLTALVGVLAALAIGLRLMPDLNAEAVTLVALGVALNLLAVALKIFATMSWEEMGKGLTTLAASLAIIAIGMNNMKGMLLKAVALNAVATSMLVLAGALRVMGSMDLKTIGKGVGTLAAVLLVLAVGLKAMGVGAIVGATALMVTAAALMLFVPALALLGSLPLATLVTGLVALMAVFAVMGLSAALLAGLTPVILGLSTAILLFGAGLALAGVGAMAAATAFGIVVAAGAGAAVVMAQMLGTLIAAIPPAMAAFAKGIILFADVINRGTPRIISAFTRILVGLLNMVIRVAPKLGQTFMVLLDTALRVIVSSTPKIVNAGLKLIVGFLNAVANNIGRIVDIAADIIVKFIDGIARNIGKIIESGVNLIIKFIEGVADAIRNNGERMGEAGADLAIALVQGVADGIKGGAKKIKDAAMDAVKAAWEAAKDFLGIGSPLMRKTVGLPMSRGTALGIRDGIPMVENEIKTLGKGAVNQLSKTMSEVDKAFALTADLDPTVTPVLDLSALTKEANKMYSILATSPIEASVSYAQAADISSVTQDDPRGPNGGEPVVQEGDTYNYEQHIHSPVPIDSVKVYRESRSLLALKKGELGE